MNKETVSIKMKDERTPEEVMKNKAKIEHQQIEEELLECEACNKKFKADELHPLADIEGEVQHEHLCENCEEMYRSEDDPIATVYYNDSDLPHEICTYRDDTEGDFKASYHRTDGWRGYYDVASDNWTAIHSDCALYGSEDEAELKKFDDEFKQTLTNMGIKYARVFSRTSNVFSTGYDFFVEKGKEAVAGAIRVMLALRYRDPERFNATALTGANPSEFDEHDKLFVKAVKFLDEGMTPEDAVEKVLEETA